MPPLVTLPGAMFAEKPLVATNTPTEVAKRVNSMIGHVIDVAKLGISTKPAEIKWAAGR